MKRAMLSLELWTCTLSAFYKNCYEYLYNTTESLLYTEAGQFDSLAALMGNKVMGGR